jgi:uncharacterized protein (DUF2252 family)
MRQLAGLGELEAWYSRADAGSLLADLKRERDARGVKEMKATTARAYASDGLQELAKLTQLVDGEPRIVSRPPSIVPIGELVRQGDDLEERLRTIYQSYRRSLQADRRTLLAAFRYCDLARKVVGIGSVGTRCWILLLLGKDNRDPLFLQLKEAQASVLEPALGRKAGRNNGRRVVEGQRLSQAVSDIFLGWTRADELDGSPRDFYVRQLRDWKVSVDIERIGSAELALYGRSCGATLARAHARSGDRVAIAAYLGKSDAFDRAIAAFATSYAVLNERDFAALRDAVQTGRLPAEDS